MSEKVRILFFASNPKDVPQLSLDKEIATIKSRIRAAEYRDDIELVSAWAVRPDDLLQELDEQLPDIVHFSGHGSHSGELILMDDSQKLKPVSTDALQALFKIFSGKVKLVVMNACYSQIQANAIAQEIDCVVGMNAEISDEAAITFASSFYRAIGFGWSVRDSFEQGKVALRLEGIPEENTPVLIHRPEIDPANIYLIQASMLDYKNIKKANIDRFGNLILKDKESNTKLINKDHEEELDTVIQNSSETQIFEFKQLYKDDKEMLSRLKSMQGRKDEKDVNLAGEKIKENVSKILREITTIKIENTIRLLKRNLQFKRDYEEMLILENDPRARQKIQNEIRRVKDDIKSNELELSGYTKTE